MYNLALCYRDLGNYSKALELTKETYEEMKEKLGVKHPLSLMLLNSLADCYIRLGNDKKSLELTKMAYEKRKVTLGENHPDTLSSLQNLAVCHKNLGNYSKALELTKIAYEKRKETLGANHPLSLMLLNNLADCFIRLGNEKKSLELAEVTYKKMKEILGENHPALLTVMNNLAIYYINLKDYEKALELTKQVYKKRRYILVDNHSDTLDSLLCLIYTLSNLEETNDINNKIKNGFIRYYENISNIKNIAFNITDIESRRNFLDSFYKVYKILKSCVFERKFNELLNYVFINKNLSFEIDVKRFHNEYLKERVGLDEVINKIDNRLIIDFYELKDNKYGLILIKKGSYVHYVVEYENIIDGSFIEDNDFIGSVENYDHIYICPDGKLYNISFERIIDSSNNISYLSSVQTLFQKREDEQTDNEEEMVSFVYPDFLGKISDDNDRGKNKGVLYGSYLEGMFIKEIYEDQASIYSLEKANHDNFFNTKRPHIFHVSTHGDYLENENLDPMDRGILCLSGYNKEEYKGYISAKEIQYMDLKNTELVVLSACNTGMGENIEGEGIYGIRRAFELAGCKTLLLTVEEIDDYNSAIFMKVFYERYKTNEKVYKSYKETKEYLKQYGIKELKELRDVFKEEMESKIKSRLIYMRNLKELDKRLEESEKLGGVVKRREDEYIKEDWNGFIIQGLIEK